jgi:hypothetical protein
MKWRRTLVLWALLFAPLSIYNIFGNPIFFPTSSQRYADSRVFDYNFSMTKPVFASDNFSVNLTLDDPPRNYKIYAQVLVHADYESYGAYGAFPLWVTIRQNGMFGYGDIARNDFVRPLPVPPTGYGAALNGPLPTNGSPETFGFMTQGANTITLNFNFTFTGIGSGSQNYGPGYFKLDMGPFTVSVTNLTTVYSLDVVSEFILAAILLPVAHATRTLFLRIRKSRIG